MNVPDYLIPDFDAAPNPAAVVQTPNARFTVFTDRLIRLEYSPDGRFEDRPSQPFWYRNHQPPSFEVAQRDDRLEITTAALKLTYRQTSAGFAPETLRIEDATPDAQHPTLSTWNFGDTNPTNLLGTYRTLDQVSGSTPLENGLLARSGWALVDDSRTLVFNSEGWLEPRGAAAGQLDLYFFGYGQDYTAALRDYAKLTGRAPLVPRWALGNWWSRYWAYTQQEVVDLMRDFQRRKIPLSVCIIDMDWHITDTGGIHSGWTGYTWNRTLFPDPDALIAWLHEQGLRTAMNLHPAEGVGAHEAAYAAMAKRLGRDPASRETIEFDITDSTFTRAYLEELHHPFERQGIDFWWMDWQQGELSGLPGLDPLWWLNHIHFYDMGRNGVTRPMIFSRWGGLGNHRYPIGFSGDTHVTWESLAFQPYFTATAANVLYGWWSHDIGGHFNGIEEPELYARWVQYGVFSPIFRLHSTNNPFHDRRPWGWDAETERVASAAMRLRHALIPYIYSMAWRDHTEQQALCQPMYHHYPERDEAYHCPQQYTFGTELIAAPYTTPADPDTRLSRQVVWLPEGDWFDFATGQHYAGGRWHAVYGPLAHTPVFAKAGAIVPLAAEQGWSETGNPAIIDLHLFAGADNSFTLYEDDGTTLAFQNGRYAQTRIEQRWQDGQMILTIHPATGAPDLLPPEREWRIHLHNITNPSQSSGSAEVSTQYDAERELLTLSPILNEPTTPLTLTFKAELARRDRTAETLLRLLKAFRLGVETVYYLARRVDEIIHDPSTLSGPAAVMADSHLRAIVETLLGAGYHHINTIGPHPLTIVWNNGGETAVTYRLTEEITRWRPPNRFPTEGGVVPAFKAWRHTAAQNWHFQFNYGTLLTLFYSGK